MKKSTPAASPEAYAAALSGWQRALVEQLRTAALGVRGLEEIIKWGNIVCLSNGPVLVIRAEKDRVLFGFWRGQRLRAIEPRLKPGGKYEMATITLQEGDSIPTARARKLIREAIKLNEQFGNPTAL